MIYLNIALLVFGMIVCVFDIITQKISNSKPWGKYVRIIYAIMIILLYIELIERQWAKL